VGISVSSGGERLGSDNRLPGKESTPPRDVLLTELIGSAGD
jgi:hypothetical protein